MLLYLIYVAMTLDAFPDSEVEQFCIQQTHTSWERKITLLTYIHSTSLPVFALFFVEDGRKYFWLGDGEEENKKVINTLLISSLFCVYSVFP